MNGYAINRPRDLGPRRFAGFANNGLTDGTGVWLPPALGPMSAICSGRLLMICPSDMP
jgi:glycerol uptake facilitator protein